MSEEHTLPGEFVIVDCWGRIQAPAPPATIECTECGAEVRAEQRDGGHPLLGAFQDMLLPVVYFGPCGLPCGGLPQHMPPGLRHIMHTRSACGPWGSVMPRRLGVATSRRRLPVNPYSWSCRTWATALLHSCAAGHWHP